MKRNRWATGFTSVLLAFTLFLALDTFVIPKTFRTAESAEDAAAVTITQSGGTQKAETASDSAETAENGKDTDGTAKSASEGDSEASKAIRTAEAEEESAPVITANSYSDENMTVTLSEYEVNGTAVYVADVTVSSAEYLRTAFANGVYGKNVTAKTSEIADANDAVLAINGDYYGARESGYVIRNGVVYRDRAGTDDVLAIYGDGSMEIVDPAETTAAELAEAGAVQAFSFGPALVEDGAVAVSVNDEVGRAKASNPRTAIGMIDPLHYVFVVSDGRTDESEGLSLYELAVFLKSLGAETAYNLDGGGSSTMVFLGEVVNNPTSTGNKIRERAVSDIVYIG